MIDKKRARMSFSDANAAAGVLGGTEMRRATIMRTHDDILFLSASRKAAWKEKAVATIEISDWLHSLLKDHITNFPSRGILLHTNIPWHPEQQCPFLEGRAAEIARQNGIQLPMPGAISAEIGRIAGIAKVLSE